MTDELKPALSEGQWRVISATIGENEMDYHDHVEALANDPVGLMAFLNEYGLPADSPYKITREDVLLMRAAVQAFNDVHAEYCAERDCGLHCRANADAMEVLAAKVKALLPPL